MRWRWRFSKFWWASAAGSRSAAGAAFLEVLVVVMRSGKVADLAAARGHPSSRGICQERSSPVCATNGRGRLRHGVRSGLCDSVDRRARVVAGGDRARGGARQRGRYFRTSRPCIRGRSGSKARRPRVGARILDEGGNSSRVRPVEATGSGQTSVGLVSSEMRVNHVCPLKQEKQRRLSLHGMNPGTRLAKSQGN